MIPASLLLILVAVTLLALGLTGGSSTLLISSIVASLLAAVALVIGARQSAGARRAAEAQEPAADYSASRYDEPDFAAAPEFVAEHEFAAAMADEQARRDDFPSADEPFAADSPTSGAPASGSRDTVQFASVRDDEQGDLSADATRAPTPEPEPAPDYDRAASVINAARSENPGADAWRRDPDAVPVDEPGAEADEFDEPDADDPDDEPLPQAVRPADAVRVARLDDEVLVVDGRPRYHLPDCTHLVGRLTEPIPVNEAVELGFSPCGLCRPVERLAAAASRR
jgi:hypothetical protein